MLPDKTWVLSAAAIGRWLFVYFFCFHFFWGSTVPKGVSDGFREYFFIGMPFRAQDVKLNFKEYVSVDEEGYLLARKGCPPLCAK